MNQIRRYAFALTAFFVVGCGGDQSVEKSDQSETMNVTTGNDTVQQTGRPATPLAADQDPAVIAEMDKVLNEAIERLKYGDKTALYENEFTYLTDDATLDKYLDFKQVQYAGPDSVESITVNSYELREYNSAIVNLTVHFVGPTGNVSEIKDRIRLYYRNGRWIKPYVSQIQQQLDYEKIMKDAEEAAAAESGGN